MGFFGLELDGWYSECLGNLMGASASVQVFLVTLNFLYKFWHVIICVKYEVEDNFFDEWFLI